MLAKTPLRDLMIYWLEAQDPHAWYQWDNPGDCACARFARSLSSERAHGWFEGITGVDRLPNEWTALNEAALGRGAGVWSREWTYGRLLQRLKAQAPGYQPPPGFAAWGDREQ
jgi:hypothetical protein